MIQTTPSMRILVAMNVILTYRGRSVTDVEVAFLRKLIAEHPAMHRKALSLEVCRAWGWRQPNGVLKDAVCRGLLLALHRAGHLELPAPRHRHVNRAEWRRRAADVPIDCTPARASLRELQPTRKPNRPVKLVLALPLVKSFRELLGGCRPLVKPEPRHEVESGSHRVG